MRVNLGDPPPRFTEGVTVGDIYPAKGGRGDTRFWLVVSLGHTGRTAHCLGLNADGEVVSTCSYSAYVLNERPRIGWCAEVRDWTPAVEWEVTQ